MEEKILELSNLIKIQKIDSINTGLYYVDNDDLTIKNKEVILTKSDITDIENQILQKIYDLCERNKYSFQIKKDDTQIKVHSKMLGASMNICAYGKYALATHIIMSKEFYDKYELNLAEDLNTDYKIIFMDVEHIYLYNRGDDYVHVSENNIGIVHKGLMLFYTIDENNNLLYEIVEIGFNPELQYSKIEIL